MTEKEMQGEGFTVKDKRAFDSQGKIKEEFEKVKEKKGEEKKKEKAFTPLPEISFSSFILSISSSALLHLGEIADPQSGEKKKDLTLAKQSVDIIALLKEKTKGNLTEEEEKLLKHLLYDLRMRFVQASEK
jgi:hypothetical protein